MAHISIYQHTNTPGHSLGIFGIKWEYEYSIRGPYRKSFVHYAPYNHSTTKIWWCVTLYPTTNVFRTNFDIKSLREEHNSYKKV